MQKVLASRSMAENSSHGNIKAARCVMQVGCLAPVAAEAMAVLLAIQLCREMGMPKQWLILSILWTWIGAGWGT